jgi:hypothetical protein
MTVTLSLGLFSEVGQFVNEIELAVTSSDVPWTLVALIAPCTADPPPKTAG